MQPFPSGSTSDSTNAALSSYIADLKSSYHPFPEVVFFSSPTFNFSAFSIQTAKNSGYYVYPPAGLQCLEAALEEINIPCTIVDLNFLMLQRLAQLPEGSPLDLNRLLRSLLDEALAPWAETSAKPIIGVSAGVTVDNIFEVECHQFLQILQYLQEINRFIVLTGGVLATNARAKILGRKLAHFVITGEGENKIQYLLGHFFGPGDIPPQSGIYFRPNDSLCETEGRREPVKFRWNLVKTHLKVPLEEYNRVGSLSPFSRMAGADRRYGTVQLIRGCRGNCSFCGVTPFMGRGTREYSVDAVLQELEYLVRERGVEHLEWLDDDFLAHRESALQLLRGVVDRGLRITWAANNGLVAASLDREALQVMAKSGCVGFRIGIESGNDEILRKIRKPASKRRLRQAALLLQEFPELFVVGCYIIGFEGETYQQILDTFRFSLELDLSWAGFSVFQKMREETVSNEFEADVEGEARKGRHVIDFVPSKASPGGVLSAEGGPVSLRVLLEKPHEVHNSSCLSELWFAFNLFSNYVNSKYLRPAANAKPFMQWTEALISSHPANPAINLFHAISAAKCGEMEKALEHRRQTEKLLKASTYWQNRFEQYHLDKLLHFPTLEQNEVQTALSDIRSSFAWLLGRGETSTAA